MVLGPEKAAGMLEEDVIFKSKPWRYFLSSTLMHLFRGRVADKSLRIPRMAWRDHWQHILLYVFGTGIALNGFVKS